MASLRGGHGLHPNRSHLQFPGLVESSGFGKRRSATAAPRDRDQGMNLARKAPAATSTSTAASALAIFMASLRDVLAPLQSIAPRVPSSCTPRAGHLRFPSMAEETLWSGTSSQLKNFWAYV